MTLDWRKAPTPAQVARHAAAQNAPEERAGWWLVREHVSDGRVCYEALYAWVASSSGVAYVSDVDANSTLDAYVAEAPNAQWTPLGADGPVSWDAADDCDPVTRAPRDHVAPPPTHYRNAAGEVRERVPYRAAIEGVVRLRTAMGAEVMASTRDWTPCEMPK